MAEKYFPLDKKKLDELTSRFPTPFYLYDERGIRENARRLKKAFGILPGFTEFFAVKGLPNPFILKILADEGFVTDCSSLPELMLSERSGISGERIMFTSNQTPAAEYEYAYKQGAIINLDDITHIDFLHGALKTFPELISFRYNPGPLREGNAIIGKPEEAKYGLTKAQLFDAYKKAADLGAKRFGLHTMIASNELSNEYFVETGRMLYDLCVELKQALGIDMEFINIGGGMGIPYKKEQKAVDYEIIAQGIKSAYESRIKENPLFAGKEIRLYMECARVITGPYGYLITKAIHEKHIYRDYIGTDACMADLMRPGMYGAYHEIQVSGKEKAKADRVYDIVGSLCENCDKFAVQRAMPEIKVGDTLIIFDAGAHGRAMGFNYNGKLRCAELLLRPDGSVVQIRRKETIDDYFATLDFNALDSFSASIHSERR